MAAYAALLSVMQIIDNLQLHPRPPISLHKKQVHLLTQKLTFLQEFLESYNPYLACSTEADPLESRIADAAYAAEDAIESHIVDQITSEGEEISSDALYEALEMVIEEMALIETEAMKEIKQSVGVKHQLETKSTPPDSMRSSSITQNSSMVGVDDVKLQMMDRITADRPHLQIIPIVGMGGTGKTTLARNIYQERLIMEHFDICAWANISQEYSIRKILIQVLISQLKEEDGKHMSEGVLGEMLHKHLYGRKYLIIMDDMWSIDAWNRVRNFFPDNKNGSRIVVTTRQSNLASELSGHCSLGMELLDEANSWKLLSKTVFGEKGCPLELEEIAKKIGKNCKGLPLSIVVVGGVLAKSKHTREFWEYIEENLNAIVNLEDDQHCLKTLYMSYKQLPVYLKPCFLYMGVFPEDEVVRISKLTKLWSAEGFLKPVNGKSLEEIGRVYLKELVDRNLILIDELGKTGNIKKCKIHDLLRDLCLREAEKEGFYTTTPQGIVNGPRRIVISRNEDINALSSMSLARSLMWNLDEEQVAPPLSLRLLRLLDSGSYGCRVDVEFLDNVHQLVNSRFLAIVVRSEWFDERPTSIWQFWNLQTLIFADVDSMAIEAPTSIWHMPHIRHLEFTPGLYLPDPPSGQDDIVLGNLQTLGTVYSFKCSEQVIKRIPNIKKLDICYDHDFDGDRYCLIKLDCLNKLESLDCFFSKAMNASGPESLQSLTNFPHSLKKLTLRYHWDDCWEDVLDKIGELPFLEKLKLIYGSFREGQWKTTQGQFHSLKFLSLIFCYGLQVLATESSHFPCLEHLELVLDELKEITLEFAEISKLRVIDLEGCSDAAVASGKRILEEQEDLYGEAQLQLLY